MKGPLSAGHFAVALLSLSQTASALSWPRFLPDIDSLVVRRDGSSSQSAASPTPTASPTGSSNNDNSNSGSSSSSGFPMHSTNLNTGGITATGTGAAHATGNSTKTSSTPKKTTFNAQDPAGGVVMVTPAATAGLQLYRIGDYVTWGWNYTNLQADPTAIDLYVKCSSVAQPWTVTQNMSFAEPGSFTWDTNKFQSSHVANPLLTDEYTLIIADADGGISATAEPGYLAPYSQYVFGLYTSQPYVDTGDGYQCASCSGAASAGLDGKALGAAVVMSAVTVLSFTWFVAGFGGLL